MKTIKLITLLAILHFAFCILHCQADLSATVKPGYTFGTGERPTTATLNLLANPTITITGTIGGTNAGLTAKSVNGEQLADDVVDDVTIQFDGSTPHRALQVLTAGLAGPGLTGATAGGPLTNNVDGVTIRITNDVVTLHTNIPLVYLACPSNYVTIGTGSGYLTNVSLAVLAALLTNTPALIGQSFTSTNVPLVNTWSGTVLNIAHGLGATPKTVAAVIVCLTSELGYAVGDEVDAGELQRVLGTELYTQQIFAGANSTNVFAVARPRQTVSGIFSLLNKSTGDTEDLTSANWALKIYARP